MSILHELLRRIIEKKSFRTENKEWRPEARRSNIFYRNRKKNTVLKKGSSVVHWKKSRNNLNRSNMYEILAFNRNLFSPTGRK